MEAVLITGGTGSFGKEFIKKLLSNPKSPKRIVIYSRDELKQWEMQKIYPPDEYPMLRFFIGDIRDKERLSRAMEGIDTVVHAAALKQVPAAEYNPIEFVKTNVIGSQNIIDCCLDNNVKRVVSLSTDKAAAPINLYGATKLCADKLFLAANNIRGSRDIRFCVVRYGNVMGSRGSVIPLFKEKAKTGVIPITSNEMTRFNILLRDGVEMVLWALDSMVGGELFVPKIASYRITDLAKSICPECTQRVIGIRPGEKLHEEMITSADSYNTYDLGKYYAIVSPALTEYINPKIAPENIRKVQIGFTYNSKDNDEFLTVDALRELISSEVELS